MTVVSFLLYDLTEQFLSETAPFLYTIRFDTTSGFPQRGKAPGYYDSRTEGIVLRVFGLCPGISPPKVVLTWNILIFR